MDNFRANKTPRRRPTNSLEGVIEKGKSNQVRSGQQAKGKSGKPAPAGSSPISRLDNFKQTDGFHSVGQPRLQTASVPTPASQQANVQGRNPRRDKRGRIDMS